MTDSPDRPRRFDLVVFDWDGTLFDSTALIVQSIQAACRDLGLPVPDDERASWVIGLSLRSAMEHAVPAITQEQIPQMVDGSRFNTGLDVVAADQLDQYNAFLDTLGIGS